MLRATIDTETFNTLILSMGLDASSDAFVVNREGVFPDAFEVLRPGLGEMPLPRAAHQL
jgi:hypothetical protein